MKLLMSSRKRFDGVLSVALEGRWGLILRKVVGSERQLDAKIQWAEATVVDEKNFRLFEKEMLSSFENYSPSSQWVLVEKVIAMHEGDGSPSFDVEFSRSRVSVLKMYL